MSKVVVYTYLAGEGKLYSPQDTTTDCDYVVFADKDPKVKGWQFRPFSVKLKPNVARAKEPKFFPWTHFPDHKYSVAIDHHVLVKRGFSPERMEEILDGGHTAMHPNEWRDCTYQEFTACFEQEKAPHSQLLPQIEHYESEGFPEGLGLHTAMVIYRKHPDCKDFMTDWWFEMNEWKHRRDQMSLEYTCWKHGHKITTVKGTARHNPDFTAMKFAKLTP